MKRSTQLVTMTFPAASITDASMLGISLMGPLRGQASEVVGLSCGRRRQASLERLSVKPPPSGSVRPRRRGWSWHELLDGVLEVFGIDRLGAVQGGGRQRVMGDAVDLVPAGCARSGTAPRRRADRTATVRNRRA
ncbi:MAG: hypothetical protein OXK81_14600 [Chloroflexota bacterium]|nr:hypothetical protein [Chloroflexota bacterium]